jgi:hypothetical protein
MFSDPFIPLPGSFPEEPVLYDDIVAIFGNLRERQRERECVSQFEIRNCILRCYTPPVIQVRISSRATPSPTRGLFKAGRVCGGRLYNRVLLDTK